MKRDGATISLWQDTNKDQTFTSTALQSCDVLIVGGGITGITTALLLQKAGKKCIVAEAYNLCFGTSGGTTSHINTFFDTTYDQIQSDFSKEAAQLVAKAANQSRELFSRHVQEYNIDCGFEEKQGYVFAVEEEQVEELDKIYEASKEVGVAVEYTDSIPVPQSFVKAIVFAKQAQVHPTRYVSSLARALEEAGGSVLENCHVQDFTSESPRSFQYRRSLKISSETHMFFPSYL